MNVIKKLKSGLLQREADLKEADNDAKELADLVRVKDGVIKDLQASLTTAKDEIARLRDELSQRSAPDQPAPDSDPKRPPGSPPTV